MLFTLTKTAILAMGLALTNNASADDYLKWTFGSATFSDGASLTGSFTEDTTTGKITNFNIFAQAGILTAYTYNPSTSTASTNVPADQSNIGWELGPNAVAFYTKDHSRYMTLLFSNSLLTASTNNSIVTGFGAPNSGSYECIHCLNGRYLVGDVFSQSVAAVPEPEEWVMMLLGLPLIGWAIRNRQDSVSPVAALFSDKI